MHMKTLTTVLFVASLALAADAKDEVEGKWKIVSVERDGKAVEMWTDGLRTMKDGKYELKPKTGDAVTGGYKIVDAKAKPKTIDFTPDGGQFKGKTLLGIYAVDGDTLKICFAEPGKDRPTEFTSKGCVLAVHKREK
jgi:uncharacterized protein (TIGR03067 family)